MLAGARALAGTKRATTDVRTLGRHVRDNQTHRLTRMHTTQSIYEAHTHSPQFLGSLWTGTAAVHAPIGAWPGSPAAGTGCARAQGHNHTRPA
jgi:hypothetical protein